MNEVQVVCTVLSTDKDQDPDIAAMIGTSAALAIYPDYLLKVQLVRQGLAIRMGLICKSWVRGAKRWRIEHDGGWDGGGRIDGRV